MGRLPWNLYQAKGSLLKARGNQYYGTSFEKSFILRPTGKETQEGLKSVSLIWGLVKHELVEDVLVGRNAGGAGFN